MSGQFLKVHILNVGQADAIVLEFPSGRLGVVDFGHPYLLSFLADINPNRTRRFAFCLLTHAHHDHYQSLGQFIATYDDLVDEYWFSIGRASLFNGFKRIPQLVALRQAIKRRKDGNDRYQLFAAPGPRSFMLEPNVEVIAFSPNGADELTQSENALSIVLLLRYGNAAVILGADAEAPRWTRIVTQMDKLGQSIASDLVKAPHHGAAPPSGIPDNLWSKLLRSSNASVVAFSVGRESKKPALSTISITRTLAKVRCTGRAAICKPLGQSNGPSIITHNPRDLIDMTLLPAPESQGPQTSCFGTQTYTFAQSGFLQAISQIPSPPLDACQ